MNFTAEICETLEQKARNCRDNARAERAVYDAFIDEYHRGITGHPDASPETHKRSMELYDFTMKGQHRERDFTRDAELFETLAAIGREALEKHS
ncbi:hypothetical protein FHV99_004616 [Ochrobactrum sp. P20RRXII]|nr:hypothetical protein [Ochrobactrum sp. P20RRXII]NIH77364.1 hypothetical protein [Ochrobactrum sp. P20RRXII]